MKIYRVCKFGMECKANGHDIKDNSYLMSQVDYIDQPDDRIKDFNSLSDAKIFALEFSKKLKRYEFSAPNGRMFAFEWLDIQGYDVEIDEDGEVESEDFDGNIYAQYIGE